ncbi:MAG: sulfate adenylyltransferase [Lachnospiraceae bacterium]|nr:sulfate adenylyltransferase [Lachnospiraceae bacterium]
MKGLLKFITCGSVDDGKSTLIGHILYDSKLIYADQKDALILDSKVGSRGGEIDYSLLLDGLMAEREQGITIDVAYRYFTTEKRSFIVADTPGHEQYTRNMAVGASFASLAIVMVDARHGVLVQTRRHARICSLMGIKYFVFAVNKMDLVGYSEERFKEISAEIRELAASLGLYSVEIIPVSATEGDNITKRSGNTPWYPGKPLLTYLEEVDVTEDEESDHFYLPIQRVCRPSLDFRGFQGQIEKGVLKKGQKLHTLPGGEDATVVKIYVGDREADEAVAGQAVTVCLDREVDVSRGSVLTDLDTLVPISEFEATILWMDDEKLTAGKDYLLKVGTKKTGAVVSDLIYSIDVNTGEHNKVTELTKNGIARCRITLTDKAIVDTFKNNKTLGEIILIDRVSHQTSACGVVEKVRSQKAAYFEKDDITTGGYIFEEFYFNLENAFLAKENEAERSYHVGDAVNVEGDSFRYPAFFDIIAADDKAAILIRDKKVFDIIPLSEYRYQGLPLTDERGFALKIASTEDYERFIKEYQATPEDKKQVFHNRWSRFETYRRIICSDNFWVI